MRLEARQLGIIVGAIQAPAIHLTACRVQKQEMQ